MHTCRQTFVQFTEDSETGESTYQVFGELVDVTEGLEAGEVRPDPGDHDAD